MAKVSVAIGFTLKLAPNSTEHARYDIRVDDIDTEGDVEFQLNQAIVPLQQAATWVENRLFEALQESGLVKEVKARALEMGQ